MRVKGRVTGRGKGIGIGIGRGRGRVQALAVVFGVYAQGCEEEASRRHREVGCGISGCVITVKIHGCKHS